MSNTEIPRYNFVTWPRALRLALIVLLFHSRSPVAWPWRTDRDAVDRLSSRRRSGGQQRRHESNDSGTGAVASGLVAGTSGGQDGDAEPAPDPDPEPDPKFDG